MRKSAQLINEAVGDIERGCSTVTLFLKMMQVCGHLLKDIERLEKKVKTMQKETQ